MAKLTTAEIDVKSRMIADPSRFDIWLQRNLEIIRHWMYTDDWHWVGTAGEPAFLNGWANWGGTTEDVAFRFQGHNRLALIGHVTGGPNGDSAVFQLPDSSYYPNKDAEFPAMVHKGSGVEMAAAELHQDGTFQLHGISAAMTHVSMHVLINLDN